MHTSRMRSSDLWTGVLFIGIGLVFFTMSLSFKIDSAVHMGPGYFPIFLSSILTGIGILLTIRSLWTVETVKSMRLKGIYPTLIASIYFGAVVESGGLILAMSGTMLIASFSDRDSFTRTVTLIVISTTVCVIGARALGLPFRLVPGLD